MQELEPFLGRGQASPGKGGTYGLRSGIVEHVRGNVESLALDLVRPASVVPQAADDCTNICLCEGDGLAVVERLDGGDEFHVLLDEVCELVHEDTAFLRGRLPPSSLEGLPGGVNRDVDILLCGLGQGNDDFLS